MIEAICIGAEAGIFLELELPRSINSQRGNTMLTANETKIAASFRSVRRRIRSGAGSQRPERAQS